MHNLIIVAALFAATPLAAQTGQMDPNMKMDHGMKMDPGMNMEPGMKMDGKMAGMDKMGMMKNTPVNPYAEAGMDMHHKMMVTGADASETWTRQMIEHHRGAIAMSKIAVAKANDKETRGMAQKSITAQEKDVADLQSWLKRHGKSAQ